MEFNALTLFIALSIGAFSNLTGKQVAERCPEIPRPLWWIGILIPYGVVHFLMLKEPAFARMIGLCTTLLLAMKTITYMEWLKTGGKPMPMLRWFLFSFLWFGMQPKAWVGKRRKIEWLSHLKAGLLAIALGALGFSAYLASKLQYFPLSFIFMSMMFHYGVLRLNTTLWRAAGFPVRILFRNPLVTTGFKDFWGARWNLAYSQMMARTVQKPLDQKLGKKGAIFTVFLVSGFFHELAISVPVQQGYGLPFLFFLFHGIAVLLEKRPHRLIGLLCLLTLILGLPILFPIDFVSEIIEPVEKLWKTTFPYYCHP